MFFTPIFKQHGPPWTRRRDDDGTGGGLGKNNEERTSNTKPCWDQK